MGSTNSLRRTPSVILVTTVALLLGGAPMAAHALSVTTSNSSAMIPYELDGDTNETILVYNGGYLTITGGTHAGQLRVYAGGNVTIEGAYVVHTTDGSSYGSADYDDATKTLKITPGGSGNDLPWTGEVAYKYATDLEATDPCSIQVSSLADITFTVAANGGGNGSTNEPPEAVDDDDAETTINTAVTIDVLDNDSDPDGDPLTIVSVTQPASGTAAIDGESIIYTPTANFVGTDEFDYTISDGKDNEASATVTVTVKPGSIEIDIKPGDDTNRVNLGSNGVIPVAIFSTEGFDATELDPGSIFLAGSGVRVRGKGNKYLASQEDINGDGLLDLVVKVETQNLDPDTFQDGGAYLHVHMTSDQNSPVLYEGWDSLTIVPPEK